MYYFCDWFKAGFLNLSTTDTSVWIAASGGGCFVHGRTISTSLTSLVAQTVKNLPAMKKAWVQSLGWEDPLEKEMATHSSILLGESHGQRSLAAVHGVVKSQT